jgi:hypothetical protein
MSIKFTNEGSSLGHCECGEMVFIGKYGAKCDNCGREYNAVGQEIMDSDYYINDDGDY